MCVLPARNPAVGDHSSTTMKPEQERLVTVLKDTITLLCKNSLSYNKGVVVQGLICVTVDKEDVVVIQVNDSLGDAVREPCAGCGVAKETRPQAESTPRVRRKRKRSVDRSSENSSAKSPRAIEEDVEDDDEGTVTTATGRMQDNVKVKQERVNSEDEDLILIDAEIKAESYGGADYSDNDASNFSTSGQQQPHSGTVQDNSYITGFMDNSSISGIATAGSSSGSHPDGANVSWAGGAPASLDQQDVSGSQGQPNQGSSVGVFTCTFAATYARE